jgi:NADH-quinone oxidoreductase subunit J
MDFIVFAQAHVAEQSDMSFVTMLTSTTGRVVFSMLLATWGLFLLLPPRGRNKQFLCGATFLAVAMIVLLWPGLARLPAAPAYILLEALAILGGLGTISSRSPVYSAIWFASSLLAIGALMLLAGAQFLGLATVAVYAGAIVVTFLFVLMLAQPEGHSVYDRLGWGWLPTLCASLAGTSLAGMIAVSAAAGVARNDGNTEDTAGEARTFVVSAMEAALAETQDADTIDLDSLVRKVKLTRDFNGGPMLQVDLAASETRLPLTEAQFATAIRIAGGEYIPASCRIEIAYKDVLASQHVANFGGELFGRHLISIQVAAVLLLVALVGAIAMAIHGKDLVPDEGAATR